MARKRKPPYGLVQWKNTDVCMEIQCTCGTDLHVDGYFAYYVQCPKCGCIFECDPVIHLVELSKAKKTEYERQHWSRVTIVAHE